MKKIIFISVIGILVGCATVSTLQPRETDLLRMRQRVPGITLEDAQKGFRLYKYNCSGCHYLHKPDEYTIEGWQKVLPEMMGRAKMTSENDASLLRNYLFVKSR